jgi:hypothetical protein
MMLNATFNNLSGISRGSVLFVEELEYPEKTTDLSQVTYKPTICAISAFTTNVVSSNPIHDKVYSIQHHVIKFVSDLRQVGGFLWVFQFFHK